MTADEIRRAVIRISHEIVEKQAGTSGLVLVGIQRRGVPLAHRLAAAIAEHEGANVPVGALDITFYRDDLSKLGQSPVLKGTDVAATGSCRSAPTTWARTYPRRARRSCGFGCTRSMARTRWTSTRSPRRPVSAHDGHRRLMGIGA
jgi:hypothetical protein